MDTKICTVCGKEFPATPDFFHRAEGAKYGLSSWCKSCAAAKRREYRQRNQERIVAGVRRWQRENPDKRAAHLARYWTRRAANHGRPLRENDHEDV